MPNDLWMALSDDHSTALSDDHSTLEDTPEDAPQDDHWMILSDIRPGLDFPFTTCEKAQKELQRYVRFSTNPWVFIRNLSVKSFHEFDNKFDTFSRADYFEDLQVAVLYIMPSKIHGGVSQQFSRIFDGKAHGMGMPTLNFSWMGDARFGGRMREKEADNCFFPLPLPDMDNDQWPVLVVEVGVSQSRPQLHRDAIWWFRQSLDVTYVLLVDINQGQRTMTVEKWERCRPRTPRRTRNGTVAIPDPAVSEIATISQFGVAGSFTLLFESLFKRPAAGGEHDITFGNDLHCLWSGRLFT